jgi:transcriptional regulator with XRE-family HTH domain
LSLFKDKYMEKTNNQILPFVTGTHITQIAKKAKCTRSYVAKIRNGNRKHTSQKAKAIYHALKKINDALSRVQPGVDKKLQELDQD